MQCSFTFELLAFRSSLKASRGKDMFLFLKRIGRNYKYEHGETYVGKMGVFSNLKTKEIQNTGLD